MLALLIVAALSSQSQCTIVQKGPQIYVVNSSRTASYAYRVSVYVNGKSTAQKWQGVLKPRQRKKAGVKDARGAWRFKVDRCKKV